MYELPEMNKYGDYEPSLIQRRVLKNMLDQGPKHQFRIMSETNVDSETLQQMEMMGFIKLANKEQVIYIITEMGAKEVFNNG